MRMPLARTASTIRAPLGALTALLLGATAVACGPTASEADAEFHGGVSASEEADPEAIRSFDFGNATWQDMWLDTEVTLVDGEHREENGEFDTSAWELIADPEYSDLDGDGFTDAMAGLRTIHANAEARIWYFWTWSDGAPKQILDPVFVGGLCTDELETVTPTEGGFALEARLRGFNQRVCAERPNTPVEYEVGLHEGHPAKINPHLSAVHSCEQYDEIYHSLTVSPRLAPSPDAPVFAEAKEYPTAYVDTSYAETDEQGGQWRLLRLVEDPNRSWETSYCGWVSVDELPD